MICQLKNIHEYSKKQKDCLETSSRKMIQENLIKPKAKIGLSIFLDLISKWRNDLKIKKINHIKLLQTILDESGYSAMLKNVRIKLEVNGKILQTTGEQLNLNILG